jgi:two-component system phosphate regulon sensor histidine kinase PhoR
MLDELLSNLIDNAIKYNREDGKIEVALTQNKSFTKIDVSDTGIGIPDGHKDRVFERFYRVDKSRSKDTGGTGLGLSIVKHISEHHGGRVTIKSVEGLGTTISCWIKNP